jgi:hypothetical protein
MRRLIILASVVVLSVSTACGGGNPVSPSEARGGGGGPKGKPSGGGSGSLTLVMVSDANGNGSPNWGDSVKFDVSTTATTQPNVSLTCSQNGVVVYGATTGYYASYPWPWTQTMKLSSNMWQGGAASCVAKLYYFTGTSQTDLSSISFTAYE